MTLFRIAFRNVLKNRRRSLVTMFAIGFGFMAVAMFKGYTHQAYEKIALGAIFVENPGHLTIFKHGFLKEGRLYPEKYLFNQSEVKKLKNALAEKGRFPWVAERLSISGLVSNGRVSTIFLADAIDPRDETALWSHYRGRQWTMRQTLPNDDPAGVLVGPDLMDLLKISKKDTLVLSGTTQYGQMNAVDAVVYGPYATMNDAMNDKYLRLPLSLAKTLYDTDGCDRIGVLCERIEKTREGKVVALQAAQAAGIDVDVMTWDELSLYYGKAKDFLDVVFAFLFSITSIIVVLSTINTMSMSIYERTREAGTLRAIGLKPVAMIAMFSMEGGILGVAGTALGFILTLSGRILVSLADIRYKPPGVAESVRIEIDLVPTVLLTICGLFVLLSIAAAALPARRLSRTPIVDALGHV